MIEAEGRPAPEHHSQHLPCARPGRLAPHAWPPDGRSLHDLFALVAAKEAHAAHGARAEHDPRRLGVPLEVIRPGGIEVRALYGAILTLVRPDQHVARRGDEWRPVLENAVGAVGP